jgi:GNAT superfamily N-acetyltransferase
VSVRAAEPGDVAAIWNMVLELAEYERLLDAVTGSADALGEHLFSAQPACQCQVAVADSQIVGYALTFRSYSTFRTRPGIWLEDLYVKPAFRGKGLGKALLSATIESGRTMGAGRVEWSVLDWYTPSIEFYKKMGAALLSDWNICRVTL